jgi:chaperone modulatory protein CbpM
VSTALVRSVRLGPSAVEAATSIHPELLRRLVALGLLDAETGALGDLRFPPSVVIRIARIQRLHADLSLNYAAIGLVLDLLDRIDRLEAELGRSPRPNQ